MCVCVRPQGTLLKKDTNTGYMNTGWFAQAKKITLGIGNKMDQKTKKKNFNCLIFYLEECSKAWCLDWEYNGLN